MGDNPIHRFLRIGCRNGLVGKFGISKRNGEIVDVCCLHGYDNFGLREGSDRFELVLLPIG